MHTEEQARELWCPMVRHVVNAETVAAGNRFEEGFHANECRCVVSQCAMWRWLSASPQKWLDATVKGVTHLDAEPPSTPDVKPPQGWDWVASSENGDNGGGWREPPDQADARRQGYCGLAGQPVSP